MNNKLKQAATVFAQFEQAIIRLARLVAQSITKKKEPAQEPLTEQDFLNLSGSDKSNPANVDMVMVFNPQRVVKKLPKSGYKGKKQLTTRRYKK